MRAPRSVEKRRSRERASPSPLAARPEARAFSIDLLLRLVGEGRIRIPELQRGLEWSNQDRLTLFDSILRGYPIGALLLWRREGEASAFYIGRHRVTAPHRQDAFLVVDGQQRVATLTEALVPLDPNEPLIHYDLEHQGFVYARSSGDLPLFLPIGIAIDDAKLVDWLAEHDSLSAELRGRAVEVGKSLREYQVSAYIVETEDEGVLREIFRRTNRAGRELTEGNALNALFRAKAEHQPSDLTKLARVPLEMRFGQIHEVDALNVVLAIAGSPMERDVAEPLDAALLAEALPEAASALRRTVVFLQKDARVPVYALLPYALPLVVLSKFFHLFPEPLVRSKLLLRRWLWRGSLAGTPLGVVSKHLASVVPGEEERSVQRLLALVGSTPGDVADLEPFQLGSARSKIQCCVLASKGPKSLIDDKPIDLFQLLEADGDEKVMRFVPYRKGDDSVRRGLANRLLHPILSTSKLRSAIEGASDAALASHGITRAARASFLKGELDRFFHARTKVLEQWIGLYVRKQAEWGAGDRASIASLRVEED